MVNWLSKLNWAIKAGTSALNRQGKINTASVSLERILVLEAKVAQQHSFLQQKYINRALILSFASNVAHSGGAHNTCLSKCDCTKTGKT